MREEIGDFAFAHFIWMALAMKEDEATYPFNISLLGADRIVFYSQVPADAIEQFRRGSDGSSSWGHAWILLNPATDRKRVWRIGTPACKNQRNFATARAELAARKAWGNARAGYRRRHG